MFRKLQPVVLLAFLLAQPAGAADLVVDGVPIPADASVAAAVPGSAFQQWRGVWVGVWRGGLKHILLVESVSEDGAAMSYMRSATIPLPEFSRGGCALRG